MTDLERPQSKVSEASINALREEGVRTEFAVGEEIFAEGEAGDSLVVIQSGLVRVVRHAASGRASILSFLTAGDIVGEIACIGGLPRAATVECVTPVEAYRLRRNTLFALMERDFSIAREFMELMCYRLHTTDIIAQRAGAQNMRAKLAGALAMLAEQHGVEQDGGIRVNLQITRSDFGGYAGLSRENVSRVFSDWKRDGILTFGSSDRHVTILDMDALDDLSHEE